jgi:glycosyltransferase involved in cell wall biosynthesis
MESVPPKLYGGTERIVSYLTEELVRQGHDVTLFASGDSQTLAELVPCSPRALRLARVHDPMPYNILQLNHVLKRSDEFDILHFHNDCLHFPFMRNSAATAVTTLHGRLDLPDLPPLFREFDDMPLVSISAHQRRPLSANWVATVHHGLPSELYSSSHDGQGNYLAFLGRVCPDKGLDRAIEIAHRAGYPLKIAAKVDKVDQAYFDDVIVPLLGKPNIEFIGEIGEDQKAAFLGKAKALLFPIDWPEPFGLVMIEAMACGTPVIAWPCGSVQEIIEPGVTGFVVDSVQDALIALKQVDSLSRNLVRKRFEARFTAELMARNYLRVYRALLDRRTMPTSKIKAPASLALIKPVNGSGKAYASVQRDLL